jgi:hypothetical protein
MPRRNASMSKITFSNRIRVQIALRSTGKSQNAKRQYKNREIKTTKNNFNFGDLSQKSYRNAEERRQTATL